MRYSWKSFLAGLALTAGVQAQTVRVSMTLDDADGVLTPNESTTLHLFAEVDGGQPGNGIYGYALNLVESNAPIVQLIPGSVVQFGDAFALGPGTILDTGLVDVYAGDGGFFINPNRGIGSPFELLSVNLTADSLEGYTTIAAGRASHGFELGAPDGFLLQIPGHVNVDFGPGVSIHVVPEPSTVILLLLLVTTRAAVPRGLATRPSNVDRGRTTESVLGRRRASYRS